MDFIIGLLVTFFKGTKVDSILVVIDRFTKINYYFPVLTTIISSGLINLLYNQIFLLKGAPNGIVSDRRSVFTSVF